MTQNNLELMRTLDESWNAQDWDTFEKRHSKDTAVFWPGQAEPTRGRDNHKAESVSWCSLMGVLSKGWTMARGRILRRIG
jgi:hypothetical protein